MTVLRDLGEMAFGVLLAVGALFNITYTLRHGADFYNSFVDGAWLSPARALVKTVIVPNAAVVTVGLVAFQAASAALILSRGDLVELGLIFGAAFALVAAVASSPGGAVANVVLAALMGALAATG